MIWMCDSSLILLVEDEAAIREPLKALLELQGYRVETAENGLDAMRQLDRLGAPCVIVLDLVMPVMNGWQFAAAKQKDVRFAPVPIVVVTATPDNPPEEAVEVLEKPIDLQTLGAVLRCYCHTG